MGKIKLRIKGERESVRPITPISYPVVNNGSSWKEEDSSAVKVPVEIREIIREVPVEIIKTVEVERRVEVPVEVIKTIEVEKIVEVIKEVPIIKQEIVEKIIIKDIPQFIDRIVVKYKTPDYITGILIVQSIINVMLILSVVFK